MNWIQVNIKELNYSNDVIKKMNDVQLNVKNEIIRLEGDTKRLNQLKAELTRHQQKLDDPQIKFPPWAARDWARPSPRISMAMACVSL